MKHSSDPMDMALSFQRGEKQGFDFFFNDLYSALLYYSYRIIGDEVLAEDVVEESFIKIWERYEHFRHPKVIKSWMYTTVRNGSLNRVLVEQRKLKREWNIFEATPVIETAVDENMIRAEMIREIHSIMNCLPTECRNVFHFIYIHGLTIRETAAKMGLTISTIKNQKARGLGLIRQKLPRLLEQLR